MKHLKTFESWDMKMSKEDMIEYLGGCGYNIEELKDFSEGELEMICNQSEPMEENYGMDKESMVEYLCRCGYSLRELMSMSEEDLHKICMETGKQNMS